MEEICPLCSRTTETGIWESEISSDPIKLENQIENLDRALEDLKDKRTSILFYSENKERMCPMCKSLIAGLETERDREELEERINRKIEELEEIRDQKIPGKP